MQSLNLFGLNVIGKFRPVIVNDGECRFCLWIVGRIRRFDCNGYFGYLPRQADGWRSGFPFSLVPDSTPAYASLDPSRSRLASTYFSCGVCFLRSSLARYFSSNS